MITVKNIHKTFGVQELFNGASLQINSGDRTALVGPNGSGKSTLFRMLLGECQPDSGEIEFRRGVRLGYLPQENAPISESGILEETMSHCDGDDGRLTAKAKTILMGLGFKIPDFDRKVNTLSGGWAMRVAMARLLLQDPDLLMLDEPTNHLDLESLFWFQNYLLNYRGAIFIISHDRSFINSICGRIASLQEKTLKIYVGNYEDYLRERAAERERLESSFISQQKEIADMRDFINRNRVRASTASRAQSMIKRLEKMEIIELPEEAKKLKIRFPQPQRTGARVLSLKNVHKSYSGTKVYENLDFELERGWKMAFVGANGAGKSTLLKILAGEIPIDKGERFLGMNVRTGYFSQHRMEMLDPDKTVLQEATANERDLPEQTVRTVLGSFLFSGDSVFKKTGVLSGGEKSRLALVKILLDPPNVLLMDEPTTHLDLNSVDALISALRDFEGTLCFISHDLYFINSVAHQVVHVDRGKITVFPGNYEYFERRMKQSGQELPSDNSIKEARDIRTVLSRKEERQKRALQRKEESKKNQEIALAAGSSALARESIRVLTQKLENPEVYSDYSEVLKITREIETLQKQIQ